MKRKNNIILFAVSILMVILSCKETKNHEMSDLEKLRNNSNRASYPATKMDSAQAIQFITKQKIQELLDLSALYVSGNRDTEIDSVIYTQMNGYFHKPDSLTFRPLLKEMESLQVKTAKVNSLEVYKRTFGKDTLDFAKFNVEYFGNSRNSLGTYDRNAQYILISAPKQFKKEFRFYFLNFYMPPPNDSILSPVTK